MIQIAIITEGFVSTGYGHLSRCSAIASAFEKRGMEVSFFVNGDENVGKVLSSYNFSQYNWLISQERLLSDLSGKEIAIIDSYLASEKIYRSIQETVPVSIYLDDYNRIEYPNGIILNGTIGAEQIEYNRKEQQLYLLGKDYVILREAFSHQEKKLIKDTIKEVLITFGGTDPLNLTSKVTHFLNRILPNTPKYIILGAAFPFEGTIQKEIDASCKIIRNADANQMFQLMNQVDIAFSAAGQTINELAFTGTPSIIFMVADNQENNIKGCLKEGFISSFIDARTAFSEQKVTDSLTQIVNQSKRTKMSENGERLIDGKGSDRLINKTLRYGFEHYAVTRKATSDDRIPLFLLANDPDVRNNSFNTHQILFEDHCKWFEKTLTNKQRVLYVFYWSRELIGQVRFDKEQGNAIVSISVSKMFRGCGLAAEMLKKTIIEIKNEWKDILSLTAYVKNGNRASQLSFLRSGFKEVLNDNDDNKRYDYIYSTSESF
jgi:UDP-2,4-diacetamido-2,4,6-trideoxy-beta-L-altropyranose hydrolase